MATQLQITANRRNALKSTGPSSRAGKAKASQNALRHGVFATAQLLPGEDRKEFAGLRKGYLALYHPATQTEHFLVDRMIQAAWRLTRLLGLEIRVVHAHYEAEEHNARLIQNIAAAFRILHAGESPEDWDLLKLDAQPLLEWSDPVARAYMRDGEHGNTIANFTRYQTTLEKSYYRALRELDHLRAGSPRMT